MILEPLLKAQVICVCPNRSSWCDDPNYWTVCHADMGYAEYLDNQDRATACLRLRGNDAAKAALEVRPGCTWTPYCAAC